MPRANDVSRFAIKTQLTGDEILLTSESPNTGKTENISIPALVNYIGSNSNGVTQNNINEIIQLPTVNSSSISAVVDAINNANVFEILDTQLPIIAVPVSVTNRPIEEEEVPGAPSLREVYTDYYRLVGVGKGTYGVGGEFVLSSSNLFFIRTTQRTVLSTTESLPPVLYEVDGDPVTNVTGIVNSSEGPFEVVSDRDYYFQVTNNGKFNDYALFRFVGTAGTYGTEGADTAVVADFLEVETAPVGAPSSGSLTVRKIIVGSTIQTSSDDIAQAVNRSFRGQINIGGNEIVIFQATRKVAASSLTDQQIIISEEKYLWKGGEAIIASDSTLDQYELIEKQNITGPITSTGSLPGTIEDVYNSDVSTPEDAVNNNDGDIVIDTTDADQYFIVYNSDIKEGDYKVYNFIGADGTYGAGNTAAVDTDFEEITTLTADEEAASVVVSPFQDVGTGSPTTDPNTDAFRQGKIGIGENTPAELLDINGDENSGGVKVNYEYPEGLKTRINLGGEAILNEYGVPTSSKTQGWWMQFAEHEDYPNIRGYFFAGDFSGIGSNDIGMGLGISTFDNAQQARILIQPAVEGLEDNWWIRTQAVQASNTYCETVARAKGIGPKAGGEPQLDIYAQNPTLDVSRIQVGPHFIDMTNMITMFKYGQGDIIEGYTHTDDLAKTGTAATVVGAPTAVAGWDTDGNLMEIPISSVSFESSTTLSNAQLKSSTAIELVPAPGVGKVLVIESVLVRLNYVAPVFNYSGDPLTFSIQGGGLSAPLFKVNQDEMNAGEDRFYQLQELVADGVNGRIDENQAFQVACPLPPNVGGSTVDVFVTYKIKSII